MRKDERWEHEILMFKSLRLGCCSHDYYCISVAEQSRQENLPRAYKDNSTPRTDKPSSSHSIIGYVPLGTELVSTASPFFSSPSFFDVPGILNCCVVCRSILFIINFTFALLELVSFKRHDITRQQVKRNKPPQSPAMYVKTIVRGASSDMGWVMCGVLVWNREGSSAVVCCVVLLRRSRLLYNYYSQYLYLAWPGG